MASHAKTSSARSSFDGSGRLRSIYLSIVAIAIIIATLALGSGTASAIVLHPSLTDFFGPDGTSATRFSQFYVFGDAIDQAAKRLYVINRRNGNDGFYGFDLSTSGSHTPLTGFMPFATEAPEAPNVQAGIAVDNTTLSSKGTIYFPVDNRLYSASPSGAPLGGTLLAETPHEIYGVAADPTGHVWVSNLEGESLFEYSTSGTLLKTIRTQFQQGAPTTLAFDSNGDLYVGGLRGPVSKYSAPGYNDPVTVVSDAQTKAIAVDRSTNELYVADDEHGIRRYSSSGQLLEQFGTAISNAQGIAVDEANGSIYVTSSENLTGDAKVEVFQGTDLPLTVTGAASDPTDAEATLHGTVRPDGHALTDCRFEYVADSAFQDTGFTDLSSGGSVPCVPASGSIPSDFSVHAVSATVNGLNAGLSYRFRLVAANVNGVNPGQVAGFQLGLPGVETTGSPVRSSTTVHLEGRVFSHGLSTTYHFEYGDQGPCNANPCTATPAQPADSGPLIRLVSEEVTGLEPNTTYHYRLLADNGDPNSPAFGEDMEVTTRVSDAPLSHGHFPGPPGSDRGWEQVSTPDSSGNPVAGGYAFSSDGTRALYQIAGGTSLSNTGSVLSLYFAQRTPSGWQTQSIAPSRDDLAGQSWNPPAAADDLSTIAVENHGGVGSGGALFGLSPGGAPTTFQKGPAGNEFHMYTVSENGATVVATLGGSPDPDHPVASDEQVYDVTSGTPRLISLLPGGNVSPSSCSLVEESREGASPRTSHWVSADGSLVFFTCGGEIYVRDLNASETKLVSKAGCTNKFIKSTPGAAFIWCGKASGEEGDVYRYDIGDGSLKCVTCVGAGLSADISIEPSNFNDAPHRIAIAEDGSRIYFRSADSLLPGTPPNGIYRVNVATGDLAYVGFIGNSEVGDFAASTEAINPDGSVLIFGSKDSSLNPLGGGSDNGGTFQYYRYDDHDRSLVCVSCPQDGSVPKEGLSGDLLSPTGDSQAGPGATPLAADGTFAFATSTPLVPADQNTPAGGRDPEGGTDIYEWRDGRLLLVSDGLTAWPPESTPHVDGITPSGRDLFFSAAAQYTPDALDNYQRLYDARIGGGIAFPASPQPCPLEVCQGTPGGAPEEAQPGTTSFSGPGNIKPRVPRHKKPRHKRHKHAPRHRSNHGRRAAR